MQIDLSKPAYYMHVHRKYRVAHLKVAWSLDKLYNITGNLNNKRMFFFPTTFSGLLLSGPPCICFAEFSAFVFFEKTKIKKCFNETNYFEVDFIFKISKTQCIATKIVIEHCRKRSRKDRNELSLKQGKGQQLAYMRNFFIRI